MGVPAFFRWLSIKYPSIVVQCVEEHGKAIDEQGLERLPVDSSQPNPNNIELDNLYLDMNGIIHPCTHPENKAAPRNEAEMFVAIFEYIDRIFAIVRPRQVLYMAIDGVAPRAKMNQQRSRRFRAGKETREKTLTLARLRQELRSKGAYLPPEKSASEHFDSNCITPGTPFMARLADALHYYVHDRLNSDPGWKNIKVILSDANVPGEGEHKIMDYIRRQRTQPDHNPNTQHCLCGADADLIMLGLATHEPYFTIIREEFKPNQPRPCDLCGQLGHEAGDCVGAPRPEDTPKDTQDPGSQIVAVEQEFIFIRITILREYLERELRMDGLPFEYNFERAVDDWVFMCFFVGNDFLPHLPSLEIREKAIDRLVELYKRAVYKTGGWLTDSGQVNLPRVQLIMQELGQVEDEIFKSRRRGDLNYRRRQSQQQQRGGGRGGGGGPGGKRQRLGDGPAFVPAGQFAPHALGAGRGGPPPLMQNVRQEAFQMRNVDSAERNLSNLDAAQALKSMLRAPGQQDSNPRKRPSEEGPSGAAAAPAKPDPYKVGEEEDARDEVKLWEDGWRERYYQSKFGVDPSEDPKFCVHVAHEYVRGLCWVLAYYYQGCVSWKWYFPYHYAPFASDFVGISDLTIEFEKNTSPFNPLEQLMGVFPADSKSHVPPSWQHLMTEPESPVIDFYPTDFKVDLNGKKYQWQGVALLPFVDERRLLKAVEPYYSSLSHDERARNVRGPDRIFCHADHQLAALIKVLYTNGTTRSFPQEDPRPATETAIDPALTQGLTGKLWADLDVTHLPGENILSPVPLCDPIPDCQVVSSCYLDPQYASDFIFPAVLLKSVKMPDKTLKPDRLGPNDPAWRPTLGMGGPGSGHRPTNSYNPGPMQRMTAHGIQQGGGGGRNQYQQQQQQNSGGYNRGGGGGGGGYNNRNQQQQQGNFGGREHVGSYTSGGSYGYQNQPQQYQYQNQRGDGGGGGGGYQQQRRGGGGYPAPPQRRGGYQQQQQQNPRWNY